MQRKKSPYDLTDKEFLKLFKEDNSYIAKKYLGRNDGILFEENPINANNKNPKITSREIARRIRVIICLMEEKSGMKKPSFLIRIFKRTMPKFGLFAELDALTLEFIEFWNAYWQTSSTKQAY